jgi:hypothetical protein
MDSIDEKGDLDDCNDLEAPPVMFRHRSLSNSAEKPRRISVPNTKDRSKTLDRSASPSDYNRQISNISASSENMRIRSVAKLSMEELETLRRVNNKGAVSMHYPHLTENDRASSDSNIAGRLNNRNSSECAISKTELLKLDPLYQRNISSVTDAQMPKASVDLRQALERAGNFMYSLSCECDPPQNLKTRKSSCTVQ